jgi:hypothetical protein
MQKSAASLILIIDVQSQISLRHDYASEIHGERYRYGGKYVNHCLLPMQ